MDTWHRSDGSLRGYCMSNKNSTDAIFDAVVDLHNNEQIVTRTTLAAILDMKIGIIDDRLSYLVDIEKIMRVERGVYVPVIQHPVSRIMSKMVLPDGTVKIEIGDEVLTLTPKEARTLGNLVVAEAMQYSNIELGHNMAVIQSSLAGQIKRLSHQVGDLVGGGKQRELL